MYSSRFDKGVVCLREPRHLSALKKHKMWEAKRLSINMLSCKKFVNVRAERYNSAKTNGANPAVADSVL